MTPQGLRHRFALRLPPFSAWVAGALLVVGFMLPIVASAYISTGPAFDKGWYWQNPAPQGNPIYANSFPNASNGWAVGGGGTILHTNDGGHVWEAQDAPTQRELRGIDMFDASSGWVVGDNGYILRTANGGSSWTTQTAPVASILRAVSAVSTSTAWAVGNGGVILKTVNGGTNWTEQTSGSAAILYGVSAVDANTAYACGAGGAILKTVNGGTNWTTQTSGSTAILYGVSAVDANTAYACGAGGAILKTVNGGTSWTTLTSGTTTQLNAIAAVSATQVWAAGNAGLIRVTANGGTTWSTQNSTGPALNAISAGSSSAVCAAGVAGQMVTTSNGGTTWDAVYPHTDQPLNAVYYSSDTTGWAVGSTGTVARTTTGGDSWSIQQVGTANLLAVHFADANTGWAVGAAGRIIKTTNGGDTWVAQASGTPNALNGVWFTSPTTGVAVGAAGTILRTTNGGTTWTAVTSGTGNVLNAVRFANTTVGYAVGAGGVIRKSLDGGATWATVTSGTTTRLASVSCVDANTVYVAGSTGLVRRTLNGGTAWTTLATGTAQNITSVSMTSATSGWCVANTGLIYKTVNGTTWTAQTSGTTGNLLGVWARNSTTAWTVGDAGVTRRTANGTDWTSAAYGTQNLLYAMSMEDTRTGWAVGAAGTVVHTDSGGAGWAVQTPATTSNLLGVSALSTQSVIAAGAGGTVVTSADGGNSWTTRASGTTNQLNAVSFPTTTGWAVGNGGTIIKSTNSGATWATQISGTPSNLLGTYFRSTSLGWVVGAAGTIRRTTDGGATWTPQTSNTTNALNAVYFTSDTSGYAVGNTGTVLMTVNGGGTWTSVTGGVGTTNALYAVGSADSTNVVLAGAAGTVRRSVDGGLNWTTQSPGTSNDLRSLSVLAPSEQWIAGSNGTILKIADQTVPVTTLVVDPAAPDGDGGVWYATTPLIGFSASKPGTTYFSWSAGGPFTTFSAPFFAAEGNSTLYYYSADLASITEPMKSVPMKVDVTQPYTSTLVTSTAVTTSTAVIDWAAATDAVSGVRGYEVYLDAGTVPVASTTSTTAVLAGLTPNTIHEISVVTVDNAGNRSPHSLIAYVATNPIDSGPPTTALTLTPASANGVDGWYISAPLITLSSSEPGSSYFSWTSPVGPFTTYSAPFAAVEGSQTLYFYSVDALNNVEAVRSGPVMVDASPPSVPATASASAVTTSTVALEWSAGLDAGSGISRYEIYSGGGPIATSSTTSTVLAGLSPNTLYTLSVVTVDVAGNRSSGTLPVYVTTEALDATPLTTLLTVDPLPSGGWYVTTPTVTLESLPTAIPGVVFYSWNSSTGPFTSYAATITPPTNPSTLFFSAHDPAGIRAEEPLRQATFNIDATLPASPTVTASATNYSTIHLSWPPVLPTASGLAGYDVYRNGGFMASVTDPFIDATGLTQGTTYSFVVYARNGAGALSPASEVASAATPATLLPSPPSVVYAKAPSGSYAYLNWSASTDTSGDVSYRVWRSENGVDFSAIATTTGGVDGTTLTDPTLRSSTRYWYAVSTVDPRGESPLSSTTASEWASISTTATGPERVSGLTAVEASASVALSWQASANPATVGYRVMRASASLATSTVLTSVPTTATSYFDLTVQNDEPYFYSVAAVDASGVVGASSLEISARPHGIIVDPTPHTIGGDASSCICHATHTAEAPNKSDGTNKLIRFPNSTVDSMCNSCHPAATAREQFADPLAKSRHKLENTVSASAPFTCLTCHRTVTDEGKPAANLMRTNGVWLCLEETNTPAGNGFCYSCHGVGSTLPRGDLTVFEESAHATVTAPATGAGIKCDACHESHSSRNESLNKYSGYMVCMQCHTSATVDPANPDLWSRLTLNPDSNAKHAVLPQDQTNGSAMACQNCHNTHAVTHAAPLVDPHDPSPGTWKSTDGKTFCFRCHDGQALPTSAETTAWAGAVLASSAATSVTDIELAYQRNVHGFGAETTSATTNANLRPSMGYAYDTVLQCSACHDPHGSANNYTLRTRVTSADGSQVIDGAVVAPVPGGGYDLRFFCNTCHVFDPTTHESISGTSTVNFPMDCTAAGCHRHMNESGTQGELGL